MQDSGSGGAPRNTLKTGAALLGLVLLAAIAWQAVQLILMVFAGVLFGIFLQTLASWTGRLTRLSHGWSLAAVLLLLIGLAALGVHLAYPPLAAQASQLADQLPEAVKRVQSAIQETPLSRVLPAGGDPSRGIGTSLFSRLTAAVATVLDAVVAAIVILFVGIYVAANPRQYREGALRLIPPGKRDRAGDVFSALGKVLRRWLMARIVLMAVNGGLTAIALWILGVPLALVLGFIAGLLNFIPNIGPIIAAVPAVLIALIQSPQLAAYVVALYLALQMVDGYVFTPIADKEAVSLPPALIISFQVLMGILAGALGLLLATPIAAALTVMVRMVYVEDVLKEKPGDGAA